MTSVWFAATGSGEDGDEWEVLRVFATKELAEAYCNRPDRPRWQHPYAEEWEVEGSFLTEQEREAIEEAANLIDAKTYGDTATLRRLLERACECRD